MKLRYFIPAFIALVATFVGCTSDDDPIYLDSVRLSTSYVSVNTDGGTTAVDLKAAADWSIDEATVPAWLTISPMSGSAGDAVLNFSAGAATSTNKAVVKLLCGGNTQEINVLQFAQEADPTTLSVSEAVALIKAGNAPAGAVYVKGTVCRIQEISLQYGNATYFLSDDGSYGSGNWIQVYRGKWFGGESFTDANAFSIGDELTVKGVIVDYNGTPEVNTGSEVISLVKSLIKVDSLDVAELPLEGGVVNAALTCKGSGISVDVPAEAQSWLSVIGIDTQNAVVKFRAQPNTGGDRSTTVTFKTVDGGKEYSASATIAQKGAILEVPIGDFLAAEVGDTQYRLTGVIMQLYYYKEAVAGFYIQDYSGRTLVYQPKGFTGAEAKVGDIVTVVGKRGAYKETPQLTSGTFEALKYAVTEISIADFLAKEDSKDVYYMVTGTIDEIANDTYGNLYLTDGTNRLYVYGCYPGYGATGDFRKGFLSAASIQEGDQLTIIGYKDTYKETIELCGGIYFSHEP